MSDFTPGPWEAQFGEAYFVTGPDLGRVAMMMNLKGAYGLLGRRSGDEVAANTRLIAAAPDLLAALQDVDALWMHHSIAHGDGKISPLHEKVIAAIARATGEQP